MWRTLTFFLLLVLASGQAQTASGDFSAVPLSALSDTRFSALGRQALAIRPAEWRHAETAHFIYHYFSSFIAAPVSVEAEFFYGIVAKELGRAPTGGERKCHIFIFERAADWAGFQQRGRLDPWTGGLCVDGELFVLREAERKWKGDTLGHEVAHLVVQRFFGSGVPLWLNEGFAESVAARGYAAFWRARGFRARPRAPAVDPTRWIPLAQLVTLSDYPAEPLQVATFYDQAQRLVRFLAAQDARGFLALFAALAQGARFETALAQGFPGRFSTLDALEQAVKEYATREHGTSLQEP
jgi:hypothetical protein